MFGTKKSPSDNSQKISEKSHDMGVMPDIFYGGNDPDIYVEKQAKTETVVPKIEMPPAQVKKEPIVPKVQSMRRPPPPPLPGVDHVESSPGVSVASELERPIEPKNSHAGVIAGFVMILLLSGGVAVWYFFFRPTEPAVTSVVNTSVTPEVVVTTPVIDEIPAVTSTPLVTSTISESIATPTSTLVRERSLPLLSRFVAFDSDNDKLSAAEEELFQVDPEVWDTDKDGYYDGQEVLNLYNPKGLAPMRIIDSGLVQEYVNPTWQYRVYYPFQWQATSIDERDNKDVLFNAASGDYIQIKSYTKLTGESFPGWFGRVVSDQVYNDLTLQTNRFQLSYYQRKDGLVSYIDTPNQVYILILYSRAEGNDDFTHVLHMMAQSFRPGKVMVDLPEQAILPIPVESVNVSTSIPMIVSSTTSSSLFQSDFPLNSITSTIR